MLLYQSKITTGRKHGITSTSLTQELVSVKSYKAESRKQKPEGSMKTSTST
jgi:hypothetical protein